MSGWTHNHQYPTPEEIEDLRSAGGLQEFLEERYQLAGHPKADLLFQLAWAEGHSSGCSEVIGYYVEMAELLDPVNP